jgi:hypothetical protein
MSGAHWRGGPASCAGFQRHHLIPAALGQRRQFAALFDALAQEGLRLNHFAQNGLHLPADEGVAHALGHALHRGPHPAYTDVVAMRIEAIRVTIPLADRRARWQGIARIHTLQRALRRALTDQHRSGLWLNRRDPMRIFADRSYLDDAIAAMFGEE